MKKILKTINYIVLFVFILIFGIYTGFSLVSPEKVIETFRIKPFVVKSNSMKPKFVRGDILIVVKADTNTIKKGDIVAVKKNNNMLIAHMIAEEIINEDHKLVFKTKPLDKQERKEWDAEGIRRYQVIGKVKTVIPKVGYFVLFLQNPFISIPIILVLLAYIYMKKYKEKDDLDINLRKRTKNKNIKK